MLVYISVLYKIIYLKDYKKAHLAYAKINNTMFLTFVTLASYD